jgi:polysaccharide export outer membrane protein
LGAVAVLATAGAAAATPVAQEKAAAAGKSGEAGATADSSEPAPYLIGAGDHLRLFVWKEPDLTQELSVRVDGMITVPLIGEVRAAGLTTPQLSTVVQEKLSKFLNSPSVTVGLVAAQSAQFYIVGRVARPGAFLLDKATTFLQALALAGGFTEFAKTDHVLIFRAGETQPLVVNYKKLEAGSDSGDNVHLRSGDTIVVP